MFRIFKKRQNVFLKLIHDQASLTLEGLEALKTFMISRDPAASALLSSKEKEADEARRIARIFLVFPGRSMMCWITPTVPSARWKS
jgi:hypothetical protein